MEAPWLTPPKKLKKVSSAGKVMASFGIVRGLSWWIILRKACMIDGAYYAEELRPPIRRLWRKEEERWLKVFCSCKIMHQLSSLKLLWLLRLKAVSRSFLHPLYSPDLAPSDFYLFPNLKTILCGRNFWSNEGVIDAVDKYLGDQEDGFHFEGISKLEQRWRNYIEAKGDYI